VIDLEDLSSGVSIADLTLTDFRIDLAGFLSDHQHILEKLPLGTFAVTSPTHDDAEIAPGVIFCLRNVDRSVGFSPQPVDDSTVAKATATPFEPGYPLAPHYLVHVGDDGATLVAFPQAKQILDRLRRLCVGRDLPDAEAVARFDRATRGAGRSTRCQEAARREWRSHAR
jgi:hypothetical protein